MKTRAIFLARMGATRLPGKVLKPIRGIPVSSVLVDRMAAENPLFAPELAAHLLVATS